MMDHERGTMEGMIPNYPRAFKAKTHDPDTSNIGEVLSVPYREQFHEAMQTETQEIEGHNTWDIMKWSSFSKEANLLPST